MAGLRLRSFMPSCHAGTGRCWQRVPCTPCVCMHDWAGSLLPREAWPAWLLAAVRLSRECSPCMPVAQRRS